ncbi:LysE family translocator [Pelagibius sp. Alg239-R121]|uniref:LysE family translocator n=1 Tax=Pelagibius sp. Alg239-R121 TaxID=2993448 RepID=UPI0024A684D8|nr:LysE family translocator [Pelagibius sp. Alg239-R121]
MSSILAMCIFSLSMSISPGPVNLITLSTGANHGLRSAMPFVAGATIGFTLLLFLIGLGLGGIAAEHGLFLDILAFGGAGLICYMGFKIASSDPEIEIRIETVPSFSQGFLLQWLNPKAWAACIAGVSAFDLVGAPSRLALFVSLYFAICYLGIGSWAVIGEKIHLVFKTARSLKRFNIAMGGGLVLVALYLLFQRLA